MDRWGIWIWLSGLALGLGGEARAQTLRGEAAFPEVLRPLNRPADEAARWLEPFLEPGGTLSVVQNHILVRASKANVEKLRQVLAGLDRPAPRFQVRLRQAKGGWNVEGLARDGETAILRSANASLLVRPRKVATGMRLEILVAPERDGESARPLAVVQGQLGRWLPAGDGLEVRVEVQ